MGGWIVPPRITRAGKDKINIKPKKGLNEIDYDKFKIITTHSLYINTPEEATNLLDMTIKPDKLKPYDVFLAEEKYFKHFLKTFGQFGAQIRSNSEFLGRFLKIKNGQLSN